MGFPFNRQPTEEERDDQVIIELVKSLRAQGKDSLTVHREAAAGYARELMEQERFYPQDVLTIKVGIAKIDIVVNDDMPVHEDGETAAAIGYLDPPRVDFYYRISDHQRELLVLRELFKLLPVAAFGYAPGQQITPEFFAEFSAQVVAALYAADFDRALHALKPTWERTDGPHRRLKLSSD